MNTTELNGSEGEGNLSSEAQSAITRASARSHAAIDAAADKAKPLIDDTAAKAHDAVNAAAGRVAPAARWVSDKQEALLNARDEALDGARARINQGPLKAVALAAFLGFLAGKLT